ncbi:hypothetical protein ElyMa_002548800 [Elysia marginata]|uniref:Uncharacterized protein n=1 Tax=Elysia marginata TaxID=1093978 RepID=A0AAV4GWB3_9GAST|nr:hypothetical protein ElyMa_002548800 [Elysia marginata]
MAKRKREKKKKKKNNNNNNNNDDDDDDDDGFLHPAQLCVTYTPDRRSDGRDRTFDQEQKRNERFGFVILVIF